MVRIFDGLIQVEVEAGPIDISPGTAIVVVAEHLDTSALGDRDRTLASIGCGAARSREARGISRLRSTKRCGCRGGIFECDEVTFADRVRQTWAGHR